jgi:predicted TIM-barrel fold metal-dependent hydrolase
MKIVAVEEHFHTPEVVEAWAAAPTAVEDGTAQYAVGARAGVGERLAELGERRIQDMDDEGIDVQVLSLNSPGVQNLAPSDAVALARSANDVVAAAVAAWPERFEGFATLPTPDGDAAADELRRSVRELGLKGAMLNGRTGTRNMDHPDFAGIYETAAELKVPLYIHPQMPVPPVRAAYYSGISQKDVLGQNFDSVFASWALGWHIETGIQLLRLIYSGTFDRHPELQIIVGHWGEAVLFYSERIRVLDGMGRNLDRPLADYLRQNVYYSGSGILSERYLQWAIDLVGVERIMYSTDYPYMNAADGSLDLGNGLARSWFEQQPISDADKEKIANGNWERLSQSVSSAELSKA